jgi:hypothetical protein
MTASAGRRSRQVLSHVRWERAIAKFVLCDHPFTAFAAGERLLYVGCEYGGQLAQLADRGCRAFGVDVSGEPSQGVAHGG